jgi:hypothetical protein
MTDKTALDRRLLLSRLKRLELTLHLLSPSRPKFFSNVVRSI